MKDIKYAQFYENERLDAVGSISDIDLYEAVKVGNRPVDPNDYLVKTARALGIYVGDE